MLHNKDSKPFFSVVVPVFNASSTIGPCLEAIRSHAAKDGESIEVIVVDDASSDNSREIAEMRCDRVVRLAENRGAAGARNAGAAEAVGEILVFVDADVVVEDHVFARLRRFFYDHPDIDAAVGRYSRKALADNFLSRYHNSFTRYHHDLAGCEIDWFWGALGAIRRDVFFASGGFDERYQGASAEDLMFGRTLTRLGYRISYFPEIEVGHARRFDLRSMVINDYKKAVLGTKLTLRRSLPRKAPGFANRASISTSILLPFVLFFFLMGFIQPMMWTQALMLGAFILVINRAFYRFLNQDYKGVQFAAAILLHWTQIGIIVCAVIGGVAGTAIGRTPYGRPGWL